MMQIRRLIAAATVAASLAACGGGGSESPDLTTPGTEVGPTWTDPTPQPSFDYEQVKEYGGNFSAKSSQEALGQVASGPLLELSGEFREWYKRVSDKETAQCFLRSSKSYLENGGVLTVSFGVPGIERFSVAARNVGGEVDEIQAATSESVDTNKSGGRRTFKAKDGSPIGYAEEVEDFFSITAVTELTDLPPGVSTVSTTTTSPLEKQKALYVLGVDMDASLAFPNVTMDHMVAVSQVSTAPDAKGEMIISERVAFCPQLAT